MGFQYSEISITGQLPKKRDNVSEEDYKATVCAEALMDWGICMMGVKPPGKFGEGMAQVGNLLGIMADPDSLKEYANKFFSPLK